MAVAATDQQDTMTCTHTMDILGRTEELHSSWPRLLLLLLSALLNENAEWIVSNPTSETIQLIKDLSFEASHLKS